MSSDIRGFSCVYAQSGVSAACIVCVISFLGISIKSNIYSIQDGFSMHRSVNITFDSELLKETDRLRGRDKGSTFFEHLVRSSFTLLHDYPCNSLSIHSSYLPVPISCPPSNAL